MDLRAPLASFGKPLASYHWWFWRVGRCVAWLFGMRRDASLDMVPRQGPAVVVAPHLSFFDPLFLAAALPRPSRFIAAAFFVTRHPMLSWLMFLGGVIPVHRQRKDPSGVRKALRLLAQGELVAFFPEGGRTWTGVPNLPMTPAVKLLLGLRVPIYVASFDGSYDYWPRFDPRPRPRRVHVRILTPLSILTKAPVRDLRPPQTIPRWWSDVYSPGRRAEVARAGETIRGHLGFAAAGEPGLLRLEAPGRLASLTRFLCFCPECTAAPLTFGAGSLTCRSCGLTLRPWDRGQLRWLPGRGETGETLSLHEVFMRMVSRVEARSANGLLLQEPVEIGEAPWNSADASPTSFAPAAAWLDRAGLRIVWAGREISLSLAAVATGAMMGSEILAIAAWGPGGIVYLRSAGGAMRILLTARAYLGLSFDSMNL